MFTAGMGAGHDQVATEIARRLEADGLEARAVDVWDLLPAHLGQLISWSYRGMIRHLPFVYEAIYQIWLRPHGRGRRRTSPLVTLAAPRALAWLQRNRPAAVVSTFHLSCQILGELRRQRRLSAPVASVLVDFDVHDLWAHPFVDLHLCLHPDQMERAWAAGAAEVRACGPTVRREFTAPRSSREAVRRSLGFGEEDRVVLVVAGAWGAGRVAGTVEAVKGAGDYRVVVVTGLNKALRRRLARSDDATVFGWVEDMAGLMAAADVVVENAGGLTAMEAIAAGIPVVSFQPIPGHGRANVLKMDQAGVSAYARDGRELAQLLADLTEDSPLRRRLLAKGSAMFRADAAGEVASLVRRGAPAAQRPEPRPAPSVPVSG